MTPLSAKTWGEEGGGSARKRRNTSETREKMGEGRWTWREEERSYCKEEGRERRGRRKNDGGEETSRRPRRRFIHPRCSDCSPKTIYGLPVGHRPSANLASSLYMVDDRRKRWRRERGVEKGAKILVSSLLLEHSRRGIRQIVLTRF